MSESRRIRSRPLSLSLWKGHGATFFGSSHADESTGNCYENLGAFPRGTLKSFRSFDMAILTSNRLEKAKKKKLDFRIRVGDNKRNLKEIDPNLCRVIILLLFIGSRLVTGRRITFLFILLLGFHKQPKLWKKKPLLLRVPRHASEEELLLTSVCTPLRVGRINAGLLGNRRGETF